MSPPIARDYSQETDGCQRGAAAASEDGGAPGPPPSSPRRSPRRSPRHSSPSAAGSPSSHKSAFRPLSPAQSIKSQDNASPNIFKTSAKNTFRPVSPACSPGPPRPSEVNKVTSPLQTLRTFSLLSPTMPRSLSCSPPNKFRPVTPPRSTRSLNSPVRTFQAVSPVNSIHSLHSSTSPNRSPNVFSKSPLIAQSSIPNPNPSAISPESPFHPYPGYSAFKPIRNAPSNLKPQIVSNVRVNLPNFSSAHSIANLAMSASNQKPPESTGEDPDTLRKRRGLKKRVSKSKLKTAETKEIPDNEKIDYNEPFYSKSLLQVSSDQDAEQKFPKLSRALNPGSDKLSLQSSLSVSAETNFSPKTSIPISRVDTMTIPGHPTSQLSIPSSHVSSRIHSLSNPVDVRMSSHAALSNYISSKSDISSHYVSQMDVRNLAGHLSASSLDMNSIGDHSMGGRIDTGSTSSQGHALRVIPNHFGNTNDLNMISSHFDKRSLTGSQIDFDNFVRKMEAENVFSHSRSILDMKSVPNSFTSSQIDMRNIPGSFISGGIISNRLIDGNPDGIDSRSVLDHSASRLVENNSSDDSTNSSSILGMRSSLNDSLKCYSSKIDIVNVLSSSMIQQVDSPTAMKGATGNVTLNQPEKNANGNSVSNKDGIVQAIKSDAAFTPTFLKVQPSPKRVPPSMNPEVKLDRMKLNIRKNVIENCKMETDKPVANPDTKDSKKKPSEPVSKNAREINQRKKSASASDTAVIDDDEVAIQNDTSKDSIRTRSLVTAKSLIDKFNSTMMETNEKEHRKFLFVPPSNISNPKVMLTIAQKPGGSILLPKGKVQDERSIVNRNIIKKPKESLLLPDTAPNNSKVVALKRLHQDNCDENDFENLITENQIYGNKIVIKEKTNSKGSAVNVKKIHEPEVDRKGNRIVQPNILYLSNVQLQPSPSNLMVLGNKTVFPQLTMEEQMVLIKNEPGKDEDQGKALQGGQTFRTVNPITHTVSYMKTNNVVEKQSQVLQNLLNKPNLKSGQKLIGQMGNNQIVYQLPMIIDRDRSIGKDIAKPGFVNSELTMVLTKPYVQLEDFRQHSNLKDGEKTIMSHTRDGNQLQQIAIINYKPVEAEEETFSSIDLAERRKVMKLNRKKEVKKPSSAKNVLNKSLKKLDYDDSDSGCSDDLVITKESLWITNGPAIPLDTRPEKMEFLNLFGLTTKLERNEMELKKVERSFRLDLVDRAHEAVLVASTLQDEEREYSLPVPRILENSTLSDGPEEISNKIVFFNELQLGMVSQKYKIQHEKLWKHIAKDRKKRNGPSALINYIEKTLEAQDFDCIKIPMRKLECFGDQKGWIAPAEGCRAEQYPVADLTEYQRAVSDCIDSHARDQLVIMTEIQKSVSENNKLIRRKLNKPLCMGMKRDEGSEIPMLAEKTFCEITKLSNMANRSLKIFGYQHEEGKVHLDLHEGIEEKKFEVEEYIPKISIPIVPKVISLKSIHDFNVVDISPATSMDEPRNSAAGVKMENGTHLLDENSGAADSHDGRDLESKNVESRNGGAREDAPCVFRWPGIETVLESYGVYNEECEAERARLLLQGGCLRSQLAARDSELAALGLQLRQLTAEVTVGEEQQRSLKRSLHVLNNCVRQVTA